MSEHGHGSHGGRRHHGHHDHERRRERRTFARDRSANLRAADLKAAVITISDKGSAGERIDESGPAIREKLAAIGFETVYACIVPDEVDMIGAEIQKAADEIKVDLIITTGGTGLSPRDVTPEATLKVLDREAQGFSEAIRFKTSKITPKAMLSRGVSGTRGGSLIINLPGSTKACRECMDILQPVLPHAIDILRGNTEHR